MSKPGKIAAYLLTICLLIIAGVSITIHFFLTDERIKEFVVFQAEKALGRQVSLGKIDVSLFNGITIKDFKVKEEDGKNTFIKTDAFILKYDILAILQQKIAISEINIQSPQITIIKGQDGIFNFATITALQESQTPQKTVSSKASRVLPLALAVDQIKITNAKFVLRDHTGKLPDTDLTANLSLSVALNKDLRTISYTGRFDIKGNAVFHGTKVNTTLDADFDHNTITYRADSSIGQEQVSTQGTISDYQNTPDILLNISSQRLNLDYLAALAAALPTADNKRIADKKTPVGKEVIASSLPSGLSLHGNIDIDKAIYQKITIDNFFLHYDLNRGILTISDLQAETAGGQLSSSITLDLNKPAPAYNGKLSIQQIDVSALKNPLGQALTESVSGLLSTSVNFDGAGFDLPSLKEALTAEVSYSLAQGAITNTAFSRQLAEVLNLPELQTISFADISGALSITKGGKIRLDSTLNSTDFQLSTDGKIDLDGNLNLPVSLSISPSMIKKIDKNSYISRLFANEQGGATVNLQVRGDYLTPQITLDQQALQEAAKENIMDAAINELDRVLSKEQKGSTSADNKPSAKDIRGLLNNFFGQ